MTALPTFGTEANALQVDVNNQQVAAAASATAASTSASNAASSASAASTSASGASTSATNAASSATAASGSATAASTSASNASTSATNAANSATAAASSATGLIATSTTSLTIATGSKSFTTQSGKQFSANLPVMAVDASNPSNYMFGTVSSYSSTTLVISVTAIGGSGTIANWNLSVSGIQGAIGATGPAGVPSLPRVTRTSNTMLGVSDLGKLFDITSGTFTQTFDAAATLTSGWWCYIKNSGTGDITLDPNASETIDGLTSYIMYPGECRLVQCNGTLFTTIVISSFYRAFTTSGTFTKPPGYSLFEGLAWSGGASGRNSATGVAPGGGGGGCIDFRLSASAVGTSETITIGAGGAAVSSPNTIGNLGGNSSFGSLITIRANAVTYTNGGAILYALTNQTAAVFDGYSGATSTTTLSGCSSVWGGAASSSDGSSASGNSVYGGAAGGTVSSGGNQLAGGTSSFGGNGGTSGAGVSGTDGTAPGGGGGGTQAGTQSGAGARGEIRVWGIL